MTLNLKRRVEFVWCKILIDAENRQWSDDHAFRDIVSLQQRNYKLIVDLVSKVRSGGSVSNIDLWSILLSHADKLFGNSIIVPVKNRFRISRVLPIVTNEDTAKFQAVYEEYAKSNPPINEIIDIAYFVVGSILEISRQKLSRDVVFNVGSYKEQIGVQTSKYLSISEVIRYIEEERQAIDLKYEFIASEFQGKIASAEAKFVSLKENYTALNALISELNKSSNQLTEKVNQQVDDLNKSLDNFSEKFDSRKEALEKRLQLNDLGRLWEGVAKRSKIATIVTSIIIGILVIIGFIVSYEWGGEIVDFLVKHGEASVEQSKQSDSTWIGIQLSRIIVVTVPTVLFVWVIKLLVRFLFRSLALFDDAVQRKTIMDSYFMLVERNAVDDKILPLIIWALCRQVPGHGHDGIDPPDFSEVINAGLNFKKS